MSSGRKPVASFYKRTVYKTEFDLFKKNTDLDLISLLSYDEEPPFSRETEKNIESGTKAREVRTQNSDLFKQNSCLRRKGTTWRDSSSVVRQYGDFGPRGQTRPRIQRTCKSAFGLTTRTQIPANRVNRSKSSYGSRNCQYSKFCKPYTYKDSTNINNTQRSCVASGQQTGACTRNYPKQNVNRALSVQNNAKKCDDHRPKTAKEVTGGKSNLPPRGTKSSLGLSKTETTKSRKLHENLSARILYKLGRDITKEEKRVNTTLGLCTETTDSDISEVSGDYKGIFDEDPTEIKYSTEYYVSNNDIHGKSVSKDSGFCSSTISPEHELHQGDHSKGLHENVDGFVLAENVYGDLNNTKVTEIKNCDNCDERSDDFCILSNSFSEPSEYELDDNKTSDFTDKNLVEFINDLSGLDNGKDLFEVSELDVNAEEESVRFNGSLYNEVIEDTAPVSHSSNIVCDDSIDITVADKEVVNQTMSSEARHAILETLHDMKRDGKDDKENYSVQMLHKNVSSKRRLKNNRHQYDMYMRERTNTMIRECDRGNDDNDDSYGSTMILDLKKNKNYHEETVRGNLFPSICSESKLKKNANNSSVYTLEHAKKKKYKIPGIGNYNLVMSPEQDFEITPPGFDIRYNTGTAISKEEMEPPPKFIQDRSIQKCKNWLKNVNLSPLSLKPTQTKR